MTVDRLELIRNQVMDMNGFGPRVMRRLKVCQQCGNVGASTQSFCKICGERLSTASLYQRYKEKHSCCGLCDTVVPDCAQYCPQCGEKILGAKNGPPET